MSPSDSGGITEPVECTYHPVRVVYVGGVLIQVKMEVLHIHIHSVGVVTGKQSHLILKRLRIIFLITLLDK